MAFKKYFMFLAIAALAMVMSACGTNAEGSKAETDGSASENEEGNETAELDGSVVIDGSGTVYPLMAKLAEEYMVNEQENVSVEVSRAGTSAGFKKFLAEDGTDFNNASRQIKNEETASAEELGMEVQELKVALDGLTFVIHPENDWATELTEEDLKRIFLADSGVTKWSDINPDFPDEKINTYGPNENHGTYEFFYENILEEQDLASDIDLQQEYATLINLLSEDKNAIGFFGFGYYVNNKDKLQAVQVDFGDGAVDPSLDTIAEDGDYAPFTRPVFTYLNVDHAKEKSQVLDYALYVMNHVNEFAGETGFAPVPHGEIEAHIEFLEGLQ